MTVNDGQRRRLVGSGWLPRVGLVILIGVVAAPLWVRAEAHAVAPEAPETLPPTEVTAEFAFLHGVLNPKSTGELGDSYQFLYNVGPTCVGGTRVPEPAEISSGVEHEEVSTPVFSLSSNTEYTICLVATNAALEETVGSSVTFKTALPPETPETKPATEVLGTSARVNGVLNPSQPGEAGTYRFLYRPTSTECRGVGGQETAPEPALGNEAEAVSAQLLELLPATTYSFCIVAANAADETATGAVSSFTTPSTAPSVTESSVVTVGTTETVIQAVIAPGGAATTYDAESTDGTVFATGSLPASSTSLHVQRRLVGLTPATEYHFQFIARNALGASTGPPITLTTAAATSVSAVLPDGRAYELVSGATEQGEVYEPAGPSGGLESETFSEFPFRAAANGDAVAFVGDPESIAGNGSSGNSLGNEYFADRGPGAGPTGWETTAITPPAAEGESARDGQLTTYESFSADLATGFLRARSQSVAEAAEPKGPTPCWVMYSHTLSDARNHALFTGTQTPGFCGAPEGLNQLERFLFAGATADGTQTLFQSQGALVPDAVQATAEGDNLYDAADGVPHLVSVLPNGEATTHATFGAPAIYQARNPPAFSGDISSDGSRVVWSTVVGVEEKGEVLEQPAALFDRENPTQPQSPLNGGGECTNPRDACTIQLDKAESGATGSGGGGRFWTASADGTRVLFTDCKRLTPDSTAVETEGCAHLGGLSGNFSEIAALTGADLYEYDFSRPAGSRLTDLTVDHDSADIRRADVQGVLGTSDDGAYVYFVASGALESEAGPGGASATSRTCEELAEGAEGRSEELSGHLPAGQGCNLYLWHRGAPLKFIGALAAKDDRLRQTGRSQRYGDWIPDLGSRTAAVTADGTHLVFESTQQLTGYDNSILDPTNGGEGGLEVFIYDASSGRLSCASCDPGGAPPDATSDRGAPGTHLPVSSANTFLPRWMNGDGTEVFFDTSQPLAAKDTNQKQDVYEWEAEGAGSCPTSSAPRPDDGCVFLLSGGIGSGNSYFVDASASGDNVFFTHRGPLGNAGPADDKVHLYDVRVDGGFPQMALACTGTGCQGVPPAPPAFATPASATFSGIGNFLPATPAKTTTKPLTRKQHLAKALKACRKRPTRKRVACERHARQRYGIVNRHLHRKSTTGRKR